MFGSRFFYFALCAIGALGMTPGCGDEDTNDNDDGASDGDSDSDGDTDGDADTFVDITYIATTVTENNTPLSLVEGTVLNLEFDADGTLTAGAGCNYLTGMYEIEDGMLLVAEMFMTEMGCDPDLHAQDDWYAAFLQSNPAMTAEGDTLTLRSTSDEGDVTEIVYTDEEVATPDTDLTDTTWVVDTIINELVAGTMNWVSPATIDFDTDGTLAFFTGCNQGSADYVVEGDQLILSDATWTEAGCPDTESQQLETGVLNVLGAQESITWEIDVDRLNLEVEGAGLGLTAQ